MNFKEWIYNNNIINSEEIEPNMIGFIYIITNTVNNKKYIGRKLLTMAGYKTIKGKKKKIRKESNWKTYYGSCKELTEDINNSDKKFFKREILLFCNSVAQLNYYEAKLQFINEVVETDNWYNANIVARVYKKNILNKTIN
jgi:hypothetical protein